jgi:hypothetical protein
MSIVNHRENELSLHKNKQLIGLNIDNFINSFNFEIVIMKEKIGLFLSYIEFFHKMHAKYLHRFNNRILLMYNNINSDIHFDDNNVSEDKKNEDILESNNLNLQVKINNNEEQYVLNNNNESGLTTPSNMSYKSNQNEVNKKQKSSFQSMLKKGIKKMNNIINGCNNVKAIENNYNNDISCSNLIYENELLTMEEIYNEVSCKSEKNNYYDMSLTLSNIDYDNNFTDEIPDTEVDVEEIATVDEMVSEEIATVDEMVSEEIATVDEMVSEEIATVDEMVSEEIATVQNDNNEIIDSHNITESEIVSTVSTFKIDKAQKKKKKKRTNK